MSGCEMYFLSGVTLGQGYTKAFRTQPGWSCSIWGARSKDPLGQGLLLRVGMAVEAIGLNQAAASVFPFSVCFPNLNRGCGTVQA